MASPLDIVLVDADDASRDAVARALGSAGLSVAQALGGSGALDILRTYEPGLLLLRVAPSAEPLEALIDRIRADLSLPPTRIVLLGHPSTTNARTSAMLASGVDGYIPLPLPDADLVACVNAYLERPRRRATGLAPTDSGLDSALRAQSEMLESAERIVQMGRWHMDLRAGVLGWSDATCALFGIDPGDFQGTFEHFMHFVHPEDRERLAQNIALADHDDHLLESEYRIVRPDGEVRWMYERGNLTRKEGEPVRRAGVVMDITERRRAREERDALQARNAALVEALGEIVYDWLPEADHLIWAGHYTEVLGYPPGEMGDDTGSWTRRIHPDDLDDAVATIERAIQDGQPYDLEYRFRHADGTYRWMRDSGVITARTDGGPRIVGVFTDVTARREAEDAREELLRREREARREADAARRYYQSLFECAPGCYLVLDAKDYTIVAVSDAFLEVAGARREELMGRDALGLFPDDPERPGEAPSATLRASLDRVKALGRSDVMPVQRFPLQRHTAEGSALEDRYWSVVNTPVPGPDGATAFLIHRVEDVTDFVMEKRDGAAPDDASEVLATRTQQMEADIILRSRELKRAHDELAKQSALLRMASRVSRVGAWWVDLDTDQRNHWSDEIYELLGFSRDYEPTVDEVLGLHAPSYRATLLDAFTRCARDGRAYDLQAEVLTPDGRRLWTRSIGEAVRDEHGHIVRVQGAFQDLTAQRRAEETLARSEQRFHQLADAMPFIVWTAEPDGRVDFCNREALEYFGIDEAQALTDLGQAVVHPEDRLRMREWKMASLGSGEASALEYRLRRATDGTHRWFRVQVTPVRDESGAIVKWYATCVDIHEAKRLEHEARRVAAKLTATLESFTDAFFTLDGSLRFTFLNSEAERLLDRGRDELLGELVWDEFPEARGSTFEREYDRALRDRVTVSFVEYFDPLEKWFEVRAYPSDEGLAVYFSDITQRRIDEQRIRDQATLLDRAQDAIFVQDLAHGITYWNQGAERLLGWSPDAVYGRRFADLFDLDPRENEARISEVLAADAWAGELVLRTRDDERVTVASRWSALRTETGEPRGVLVINTDVTRQNAIEAQLMRTQRLESIGTLAGGIAHDLNNVLAPILTAVAMLRMDEADPDKLEDLDMLETCAQRGADMVRQLLTFARGAHDSSPVPRLRR